MPFVHDFGLWVEPTLDGGYIATGATFGLGTLINMFCKGFKSPPFKAIFHAGISGLRSPGIYAWEDVTSILKYIFICINGLIRI